MTVFTKTLNALQHTDILLVDWIVHVRVCVCVFDKSLVTHSIQVSLFLSNTHIHTVGLAHADSVTQ